MALQLRAQARPVLGLDVATVSRVGGFTAAAIFAAAALVLVALGVAFPMALAVIERGSVPVTPADLAIAERLAPLWWAFSAAGIANLVAAFAVLDGGALGKRVAIVVAGLGTGFASAAAVALVTHSDLAPVASAVASTYFVALLASLLVRRQA